MNITVLRPSASSVLTTQCCPCRVPSQADTIYMQRLMRDVVPDAFEKFFNENSIKTWSPLVQDDILHAAFALMDLISAQLKVTMAGPTSSLISPRSELEYPALCPLGHHA